MNRSGLGYNRLLFLKVFAMFSTPASACDSRVNYDSFPTIKPTFFPLTAS